MVRKATLALGAAGGLLAAAGAWTLYQRSSTEQTPYTVVARPGDAELRRYPATVLVETTAPSESVAFGRLFRYISGANEGSAEIPMTTPVEVAGRGTEIAMTAPVEVGTAEEEGVRMAFYLPAEYDLESAPRPTDEEVHLVAAPERTLAVVRFSWRPTRDRIESESERLLATLERADIESTGEPLFMGYDAPWTLPFLRRNEVAVEVDA